MSVLEILEIGHPVLRKRARPFLDRVTDPRTLTTWEQFERFHRDEFVARITAFTERVGS